jgi:hypothetical protein
MGTTALVVVTVAVMVAVVVKVVVTGATTVVVIGAVTVVVEVVVRGAIIVTVTVVVTGIITVVVAVLVKDSGVTTKVAVASVVPIVTFTICCPCVAFAGTEILVVKLPTPVTEKLDSSLPSQKIYVVDGAANDAGNSLPVIVTLSSGCPELGLKLITAAAETKFGNIKIKEMHRTDPNNTRKTSFESFMTHLLFMSESSKALFDMTFQLIESKFCAYYSISGNAHYNPKLHLANIISQTHVRKHARFSGLSMNFFS